MVSLDEVKKAFGIRELNELQKIAIPKILEGKNTIIVAPTGFGKTEAAMIPIFKKILEEGGRCIYITPLRALNRDMFRRLISAGEKLGITVDVRHGDTPKNIRRKQAENPPQVLITTPETFQILFFGKKVRNLLKDVKYVVIDEVHELIGSKRGTQLSLGLVRLEKLFGRFQKVLLSATVKDPKRYAEYFMNGEEFEVIDFKAKKEYDVRVHYPEISEKDKELAKMLLTTEKVAWSIRKIKEIIDNTKGSILLFTNTRETAEMLSSRLKRAFPEIPIEIHHSSLSREVREEHERLLREGKLKVLIATSSMELGIDIGHIERVIQYMSPRQVKRLIQRVGRAGHRMEEISKGDIITLDFDDYCESLAIVELQRERYLEEETIHENALDVLAHQIVGILIDNGSMKIKEVYDLVRKSKYYEKLPFEKFVEVLEFLEKINLIRIKGNTISLQKRAKLYYIENVSTIPDEKSFTVIDVESNTKIGILHEDFVMKYCEVGNLIVIKGEIWRIKEISGDKIYVIQEEGTGEIPVWEGELIPVYFEVAQKATEIKEREFKKFYKEGWAPKKDEIVIEYDGRYTIINLPFGSRVNETIGRILAKRIGDLYGINVGMKFDPYRVILEFDDPSVVVRLLKEGFSYEDLAEGLKRTRSFLLRMFHVGKRFGVFSKNMEFDLSYIKKAVRSLEGTPVEEEAIREYIVEKLNVEKTKEILERIKEFEIKIVKGISEMTKECAIEIGDLYISRSNYLKLIKERLENTELVGYCLNENRIIFKRKMKEIDDFRCPKCKSILAIAKEKDLENKEKLYFNRDLIMTFGKSALYLIASIVPDNQKVSILMKFGDDLERLIQEIAKAERRVVKAVLRK